MLKHEDITAELLSELFNQSEVYVEGITNNVVQYYSYDKPTHPAVTTKCGFINLGRGLLHSVNFYELNHIYTNTKG